MSHNLGVYSRGYKGDARSLVYSSYEDRATYELTGA